MALIIVGLIVPITPRYKIQWHFRNLDLIFIIYFFSQRKHRIGLGYVNTVLILFSHLISYYLLVVNSFGRKNNVEPRIFCVEIYIVLNLPWYFQRNYTFLANFLILNQQRNIVFFRKDRCPVKLGSPVLF